jgi:hypothetical protein
MAIGSGGIVAPAGTARIVVKARYIPGMARLHPAHVAGFPGAELIERGLADLAEGRVSDTSLLVSIGAPRLARIGIPVSAPIPDAEHRLYERLAAEEPEGAHSRYNALIRRLVSFERAAECAG